MTKTQCGNRWYEKSTVNEIEMVCKYTYNEEDEVYSPCGSWTVEHFEANNEGYDENTNIEYCNICAALNLTGAGCNQ